MDGQWWKKTKKDIPGSGKLKKRPLQNEEDMKIMFGDITNDESDHWNPLSSNPIIPPSKDDVYDVPEDGDGGDETNNDGFVGDEEFEEVEERRRLVAHLDTLPYQEGKPLTTVAKTAIVLVDYSSDEHSSHRHVYNGDPNELLEQISRDEVTADAGDENDAERAARRLRN
ncbi:zinc finger CCCH domain-containing protein 43-like [Panicum miliaceum]|uniref:Zinc finger CCCH domain-containing protein 43-like n=1 Tax=Panicum miliaceum TaxID=4540 RepID=A0A3L6PDX9_PANMI|nr:zinc finger CCCH domain-containing protein 43-like [Panicum miliaceum]